MELRTINNCKTRLGKSILSSLVLLLLILVACNKNSDSPINSTDSSKDVNLMDISYGNHTRNVMDIYLPAGRDETTPVILLIHGGAWTSGRKEDLNQYVNLIMSKWPSVAIVNMNYRLASNTENIHHADIMSDIGEAIGHIISNEKNYHISDKMGTIGASAGGQLAMIYAYSYNEHNNIQCVGSLFGPSLIQDWEWYNSTNFWLGGSISTILTEYVGQSWDATVYGSVSPYWQATAESQPTIIFHGSLDPIVPVYQSQWLHSRLNTLGVDNEYHEYTAFHEFNPTQANDVVTKLVAFFQINMD